MADGAKSRGVIRPEVFALIHRGREVILGGVAVAAGLWLMALGGYLLLPFGAVVAAFGLSWGMVSLRRMRFAQGVDGPGVVEVDEGQVGYLSPGLGGFVSLPELVELRLITLRGRQVWRLKQADGQALLIPADAAGSERLFDAFASLPGMDTQALVAALVPPANGALRAVALATDARLVWQRPGKPVLSGPVS